MNPLCLSADNMLRIVAMEDGKWRVSLRSLIQRQKGVEVRRLAEGNLRFDGCRFCAIEFASARDWLDVSPKNFECQSHGASASRTMAHIYPRVRSAEPQTEITDEDREVARILAGEELRYNPRRAR